jgi:hypothetical protein
LIDCLCPSLYGSSDISKYFYKAIPDGSESLHFFVRRFEIGLTRFFYHFSMISSHFFHCCFFVSHDICFSKFITTVIAIRYKISTNSFSFLFFFEFFTCFIASFLTGSDKAAIKRILIAFSKKTTTKSVSYISDNLANTFTFYIANALYVGYCLFMDWRVEFAQFVRVGVIVTSFIIHLYKALIRHLQITTVLSESHRAKD